MREGSNATTALAIILALLVASGTYVVTTSYFVKEEPIVEEEDPICEEGEILVEGECEIVEIHIPGPEDCTKTEIWELGRELGVIKEIIDAQPTDGLWDDGRTDIGQLGLTYQELEDAMINENSKNRKKYLEIRKLNLHKIDSIPVCKIPKTNE